MFKRIFFYCLFILVFFFISNDEILSQVDRSGPVITEHSDIFKVGDKWFCPLCRKQVPNGDRSKMDPKLTLSEWHDVMIEKEYFETKIFPISDEELVKSLNLPVMNADLAKNLKTKNYDEISKITFEYFSSRKDNQRISLYDPQNKKYFITIDEFVRDVKADTFRYNRIMRSANAFYNPEKGYTLYNKNFGNKIDFCYNHPEASKWGVHYLSFIDDQINYFLLTNDAATPKVFEDVFNQWYDQIDTVQNESTVKMTKTYDFIWYELGLANRLQKFVDAYRIFGKYMSPATNKRMLKNILGSARWLAQCIEKTPFHPYNWQTHTAMTLGYVACLFPEFKESNSWLKMSRHNMELHLKNDIVDDGGYIERTTSYADYMFSIYYRYMLMMKYFKNDNYFMTKYLPRIEKFIEYFVHTNTPIGLNAAFNDARRGLSLVRVFKEMGEFFKRGDFIGAIKNNLSPETLAALKVEPKEPKVKSIDYPISKFVVMRDSWTPESYFMMTNYGQFQNHAHYDHLDFEIYANGMPIAIDAGLGKYGYVDPIHVTWYKNPLAHNMITINGAIPEKIDKFGYDKIWSPQKFSEYFAATHDGYVRYQKTKHRRHIIFVKNSYWAIIDEIMTKEKGKEIDFNFHTPSVMKVADNGFITETSKGFLLKHDSHNPASIEKFQKKGWADLTDIPGEPSSREIDWLIFRKLSSGSKAEDRLATVVYPFKTNDGLKESDVSINMIQMKDDEVACYKVISPGFEDIIIISDGKYRKFTSGIEGDFKYCIVRFQNGEVLKADFSSVKKYVLPGNIKRSFTKRRDDEFSK